MMELVLASRNKKKIEEIRRITADLPVTILSLDDFPDCPEVTEDRATFEGNAIKKAVTLCGFLGKPTVADDSGLEVDALDGAPGVYSARYAAGVDGNSDSRNNEKLLLNLKNVPDKKRGAQFVCCIALAFPDGRAKTFSGFARGHIGWRLKGTSGFGYDPLFVPEGHTRTFAEMSAEEKDRLSHRGQALAKLAEYIRATSCV